MLFLIQQWNKIIKTKTKQLIRNYQNISLWYSETTTKRMKSFSWYCFLNCFHSNSNHHSFLANKAKKYCCCKTRLRLKTVAKLILNYKRLNLTVLKQHSVPLLASLLSSCSIGLREAAKHELCWNVRIQRCYSFLHHRLLSCRFVMFHKNQFE